MRRYIFIFPLLLTCAGICSARHKTFVGADIISPICMQTAKLNIGHAFKEKWSMIAQVSINFKRTAEGWSDQENEHWHQLYGKQVGTVAFRDDFIESDLCICYWPQSAFTGPVLSAGCCIKDRSGPDITVGAGYFCRIWKGLHAGVEYRVRIMEHIGKGHMSADGIRISLGYAF